MSGIVKNEVTLEDLKKALPTKKKIITQEAVDIINKCQNEPEFQGESLMETVGTYHNVFNKRGASVIQYINAIRFVAYLSIEDKSFSG